MLTGTDYIPISVATLLPTEVVGLDLFHQETSGASKKPRSPDHTDFDHTNFACETIERYQLYRGAAYPLTLDDLNRLRGRGVHRLFITKSSQPTYQRYLRKMATSGGRHSAPLSARVGALNEVVRDVLASAFARGDSDQSVKAADKLGELAAEIITQDEFDVSDLFDVLHHDYATFTHSANVAFYCGMLGAELGFSPEEVHEVTTGGLLHDLGKLEIDEDILCKPGRLDESEFRKMKLHPLLGFRKLARRSDLSEGQLMMVYQHHERNDGTGYPVGLRGDDMHPWAKLCAIVDVFEALTSQRPYRTPMTHQKALDVLKRESGSALDPEMLQCWISIIQRNLAN